MLLITYSVLTALSIVWFECMLALEGGRDVKVLLSLLRQSVYVVTSKTKTDEERESYARRVSSQTLKSTARFAAKCSLSALLPCFLYIACTIGQPALRDSIVKQLSALKSILLLGIIVLLYSWLRTALHINSAQRVLKHLRFRSTRKTRL